MRAVIELPTIAIFTIVAGSLIIFFFFSLSQSQSAGAEKAAQAKSLNFLDTLVKTSATARNTANNISIVDDTLLFMCDDSGMRFGYESHVEMYFHNMVIFSPRQLRGGTLLVYSRGADVPYRSTNILYMTTPAYIVENATNLYEFPFKTVPINPPSRNDKRRTVINWDQRNSYPPTVLQNLVIVQEVADEEYGSVIYPGTGPIAGRTVWYPNREFLYGAILSADKKSYDCVLNAYFRQLLFTNELQANRAALLKTDGPSVCYDKYQLSAFADIQEVASLGAAGFGQAEADKLSKAIKKIEFTNYDLIRGDNCPAIY